MAPSSQSIDAPGGGAPAMWFGYWLQTNQKGDMKVELAFKDGKIEGKGMDRVGKFLIEGEYSLTPKSLRFEKMYEGHSVRYVGTWSSKEIWGIWSIGSSDIGEFRLWPAISVASTDGST